MNTQSMQKTVVAVLVAVLSLGSAGFASAQRHDNDRNARPERRDNDRNERGDRYDRRENMRRGAGPNHDMYVAAACRRNTATTTTSSAIGAAHHLRQPPRGYHWVQSGSDYLLVAVATGLIASAILNN